MTSDELNALYELIKNEQRAVCLHIAKLQAEMPTKDKRMPALGRAKQHANEAITILNLH